MSFSGTTAGATAECVETVSTSVGVSAFARAIYSLSGVVTASAGAVFGVFG